jgi:hypothetical protein
VQRPQVVQDGCWQGRYQNGSLSPVGWQRV